MTRTAQREVNRLTTEDRIDIEDRMRVTLARYGKDYRPCWADLPTFERLGWHAIGCDERDLRDAELAEITEMAKTVLGLEGS